jgi:hypothetical protein
MFRVTGRSVRALRVDTVLEAKDVRDDAPDILESEEGSSAVCSAWLTTVIGHWV